SEYSATLSETTKDYVTAWRENDLIEATNHYTNFSVHFYEIKDGILMPVTGRYDSVYVSNNSVLPKNNDKSEKIYVKNNRIYFPGGSISQDTLLHRQLRKCGWKEGDLINQDWLDKHIVDMLTYQGVNYFLIMDELHFKQDTNQRVIPNQFLLRSVFWK
ncbi:MAG: hypothetical protein II525_07450, partial [Bacteroidales bacterium]|nr:hypothetical protein [Bacteroidales bacterium]